MLAARAIDLQKGLEAAYGEYRAGRHDAALGALDPILAALPGEATALNLLGAIKLAQGDAPAACEALTRAARTQPKNAEIQSALGSALRRAGRAADSESAYRRAIAAKPDFAEAHFNLANLLLETDRPEEAGAAYRRAVGIRPDYVAALLGLGRAKERTQDFARAEEAYRTALGIEPRSPKAHLALARILGRDGVPGNESLEHYATAHSLAPGDAEIATDYGVALVRAGRTDEAYAAFQGAVARDPRKTEARVNLANLLCERGERDRALVHYLEALEVDPDCVEALVGIGNIAERDGKPGQAETAYRRALAADPKCVAAHSNLGTVLAAIGRSDAAIACFTRALAIDSDHADTYANLGHTLMGQGDWNGALVALDRALVIAPDHVDARLNRATARLLTRDFAGGWRDYLARDAKQSVGLGVHRQALPRKLDGAHVLVLADQGLGDEMFFLRFVGGLRARGARVSYRASPPIAAMVARSGATDAIVGLNETLRDVSLTVSVGDLPHLLGMASAAEIPAPLPLPPLPELRAAMSKRLAELGPAPYIGVTWRAGTNIHRNGLFKEVPRAALAAALAQVPGTLIGLQRQPAEGEMEAFAREAGRPVHDMTALNESLEEILALLAGLDDYVCVSNTNVHLRAGAGRTCRVLMPHPPEFRWMAEGAESPWFPGTTIYRQTPAGDWSAALNRIKDELK